MKVYIISCNWGSGGPGNIARDLYQTLSDAGNFCRFAFGRDTVPSEINSFCFSDKIDVYSHALLSRIADCEAFCSTRSTRRLINDIKLFEPDIISIHNELGHVLNIKVLLNFIRQSGIKTFWTLHDCWLLTGHCITGLCPKFNKGCGKCPRKREYPQTLIDRSKINYKKKKALFCPKIDNLSFITPSHWLYSLVKSSYLSNYDCHIINNGINLSFFSPHNSELRNLYELNDKIVLLSVANVWSKFKGIDYLYDLSQRLDGRFKIVIIGACIPKHILNDKNILCLDRTKNVLELVSWYSTCDYFVNPTMGDNFPTVNIEALACGAPIISFNTGGSGEIVGDCGVVVEPGNVQQLKDEIEKLPHFPREKCIRRSKLYDKDIRFFDYIKLFEKSFN